MNERGLRAAAGAVFWAAVLAWGGRFVLAERPGGDRLIDDLRSYFFRSEVTYEIGFPVPVLLEVGDPVVEAGDGRAAGEVAVLLDAGGSPIPHLQEWVSAARIRLYDRRRPALRRDASARLVQVPEFAGAWVFRTLVPPEKRRQVVAEWNDAWKRDRDRIRSAVLPLAIDLIDHLDETVEAGARAFLERHRAEIDDILRGVEREVGPDRFHDLFDRVLWPAIRRHIEPVMEEIGAEIWESLPLWSLSWRLAYQSLPFTRDDYFRERWSAFVEAEVVPIIKSHSGGFLDASRRVAKETLADPEVVGTLHDLAIALAGSPDLHRLRRLFVKEVFVENPAFRARLEEFWRSSRCRAAVELVSQRLELTVRRIGDILLGTRKEGITPGFARVLRAQILHKDKRRILIDPGTEDSRRLPPGTRLEARIESERPR